MRFHCVPRRKKRHGGRPGADIAEQEIAYMALITITRMLGCGGTDIARVVAKELDLEFYDDSRLENEAARMGMNLVEIGGLDEKAPNLLWPPQKKPQDKPPFPSGWMFGNIIASGLVCLMPSYGLCEAQCSLDVGNCMRLSPNS
jgi:hypothetical protein